jgi:hypothetical protein
MKALAIFGFLLFAATLASAQNNPAAQDSTARSHHAPLVNRPLYVVDNVLISEEEMQKINPDHIQSITVLKAQHAVDHLGEAARNGAVLITMKKEFPFRKSEIKN